MMNVSNVMNTVVNQGVKKPLNWVASSRMMDNVCKNFQGNNLKYMAAWAVGSMILKDGLGCYMYVNQSLNNKKIPEDKRKFVAALDLANGGLMILAQLIMFKTISNKAVQEKMFNGAFGKLFDRAAKKGYKTLLVKSDKIKGLTGKEFNMAFEKFQSSIKGTFGMLVTLVASTILAKRVIVPFIATPLAERAKGMLSKDSNKDSFTSQSKK